MCPTCGRPLPYAKRRHGAQYCSRACANRARTKRQHVDVYHALRLLDGYHTLEAVARELQVSKPVLLQVFADHRVVRVGGCPHRPGRYAIQHWKNPRQLSFF